jgi:hypothetical protein
LAFVKSEAGTTGLEIKRPGYLGRDAGVVLEERDIRCKRFAAAFCASSPSRNGVSCFPVTPRVSASLKADRINVLDLDRIDIKLSGDRHGYDGSPK